MNRKFSAFLAAAVLLAGCAGVEPSGPTLGEFQPSPSPTPTPVPEPGLLPLPSPAADLTLLVQSDLGGDEDIYLLDFSRGEARNLTENPAADTQPAWSPDRESFAFVSDRDGNAEIYLGRIDGSDLIRLTETESPESHPAWSPDGKTLAFFNQRNGGNAVGLLDLASGERRFLEIFPEGAGGTMIFTPDGSEIILGFEKLSQYKNYRLNLSDGDCREIINHPCPGSAMTWADGGKALIYVSGKGNQNDIWMVYLDEGRFIQLTRNEADDISPTLSPDEDLMVFCSHRHGGDNYQLFLLSLEGDPLENPVVPLTRDEANYRFPQWE